MKTVTREQDFCIKNGVCYRPCEDWEEVKAASIMPIIDRDVRLWTVVHSCGCEREEYVWTHMGERGIKAQVEQFEKQPCVACLTAQHEVAGR